MDKLYKVAVLILLSGLICAVVIEGEAIRKAVSMRYDIQDVRVVNSRGDAIPIEGTVSVQGAVEVNGGEVRGIRGPLPVAVRVER